MMRSRSNQQRANLVVAFLGAIVLALTWYVPGESAKHGLLWLGMLMAISWDGWWLKGASAALPGVFSISALVLMRTAYPYGAGICLICWALALAAKDLCSGETFWAEISKASRTVARRSR